MVLTGELEVISGISIEEEDEDADDGFGLPGSVSVPTHQHLHHVPPPQHVVGPYDSSGTYMDDAEEDVGTYVWPELWSTRHDAAVSFVSRLPNAAPTAPTTTPCVDGPPSRP